ncbi:transposase [Chryseobacterium sp. RU33C]|uniref:transposase n=1 Tax=Chryseobacterium sp. RU33C TaxID=1907398 RepID=UPI000953A339|nr:transposase [Chryseobacterium sp. RU33C]SIP92692.1 hypothetical protein SAMN05880573_101161 [Chryseobacterium sp. RU33C]
MIDIKNIHIGSIIHQKVSELDIESSRICNFIKCSDKEIEEMYQSESLEAYIILRWSKLLEYDFFRLYSQHLILYSPPAKVQQEKSHIKKQKSALPVYRKSLYTQELIYFILELIETQKKTKTQIIDEYGIPKTTLYKWIEKYKK